MPRFSCLLPTSLIWLALASASSNVVGQDPLNVPDAEKEHEWLKQFVGEWDIESKAHLGPDQPTVQCAGKLTSRMLGDFWVVNEMKATMMDTTVTGIQTIGYDAKEKRYEGTWVDSVSNHLWKYDGSVDDTGKILTLQADGPTTTPDAPPAKYRDIYEFKSADRIELKSQMLGEDGNWITFLEGTAVRAK